MIRQAELSDLNPCVSVIRRSFLSVAEKFYIPSDGAPGFTAFSISEERL